MNRGLPETTITSMIFSFKNKQPRGKARLLHACSLSGLTNPLLLSLSRQSIRHQVPSTEHQVPSAKYQESSKAQADRCKDVLRRCIAQRVQSGAAPCALQRRVKTECQRQKSKILIIRTPHPRAANAADLHPRSTVTPAEKSLSNAQNP